jgi:flavin-dependent dehydrogenase
MPVDAQHPVIVGSGLTGMSISRTLSRAKIRHVLVGGPPGDTPRLGESLNMEGTFGLLELFPELSRYFYPKRVVTGYLADHELTCNFQLDRSRGAHVIYRALGRKPVPEFLQFDRMGFDAALFEATAANPYCTVVESPVGEFRYDRERDRFSALHLRDGTELDPSYVFDASNHGRLLGKAAGIGTTLLGDPQRVAYTHYHAPAGTPVGTEAWEASTVIVRLFREDDGIDALAWCIPLGSYVSVGISLRDGETEADDDALLETAHRAFVRYGIRYGERFVRPARTMGLRHRYFIHDRAYGANWMLAGPSFCQVWWMAGAGVGSAFAAAEVAPRILRDPMGIGRTYESYLRPLVDIHETFDFFASIERASVTPGVLSSNSDRFVLGNLLRLADSTRLRRRRLPRIAGKLIGRGAARFQVVRNFCPVRVVSRADEGDCGVAEAPVPENVTADGWTAGERDDVAVVLQLLRVVSGKEPLERGRELVAQDVVCHLDALTGRGINTWGRWVAFVRSRGLVGFTADVERVETAPGGLVTVHGRIRGERDGRTVVSAPGAATYRVAGGRIVEIWTTRNNYAAVFGFRARSAAGWLLVLAQLAVWSRLPGRPDLRVPSLPATAAS